MAEGQRVPPFPSGSSPSVSAPLYMESLYSEIGRESSAGTRSPVQEFLAVARRLKSERKAARSKTSCPPEGKPEAVPASRRGRGPPDSGNMAGSSTDQTSGPSTALAMYTGGSSDLPARVVSPYFSEAARFPAPEGIDQGTVLFQGGVPPMRVLPGGCSVVVTCGQAVDGSLADSQLFGRAEVGGQITNLGACMSLLTGAAAQSRLIDLLASCCPGAAVDLTVYTIDRDDLRDAMISARRHRQARIRVLSDCRQSLTSGASVAGQRSYLLSLEREGVEVRVGCGRALAPVYAQVNRFPAFGSMSGALHAKAAHVEGVLIVGSTNWTTSSRANFEIAAEVLLSDAGKEVWRQTFSEQWEKARPIFSAEQELALRPYAPPRRNARAYSGAD